MNENSFGYAACGITCKAFLLGITLALVSTFPVMAQTTPDFTISNGTGAVISEIEIRPSHARYPKDKNICVFQNLALNDRQTIAVSLPSQMKGIDSFDVILKYGKKTAKTKQSVTLFRNGGIPQLIASIVGKPSTIPYAAVGTGGVAAGVGAAAAAAAISSGGVVVTNFAAAAGTLYGGPAIVHVLTIIGGGSLTTGVGVIVAVPVLAAAGILTAITLLSADGLILTQVN